MKTVELNLYFKQGDDFGHHLEENGGDILNALHDHEAMLVDAVRTLKMAQSILEGKTKDVEAFGDTHCIEITGPDEVMDQLIKHQVADEVIFDCDDSDEDCSECEGCDCDV